MKSRILWIILALCSCSKSLTNKEQINLAQQVVVGKWKLIQYYRDNSDGTGQWLPTDSANVQTVEFTSDGKFMHNENFVIQESIDRYKFLELNKVLLYSSHSSDSSKYFYMQDQPSELVFNPLCKEFSCMRKFTRM